MTAEDRSTIEQLMADLRDVTKTLNDTVVGLATVRSRIEHPSPDDCVMRDLIERNRQEAEKKFDAQVTLNTEIFKRLNALEQARAAINVLAGLIGAIATLCGKYVFDKLFGR